MQEKTIGVFGANGNTALQLRLLNYLKGGRLHPAVILSGDKGSDKLTLVKGIAKHLMCLDMIRSQIFCNNCSVCRRIDLDLHPDVIQFKEADEGIIKIDAVREICRQMNFTPIEAPLKICIIEDCERLNVAASNAFLKNLEEPGPNRYFWLLTSQPWALLPTLLSRCLKFQLYPSDKPEEKSDCVFKEFDDVITTKDLSPLLSAINSKDKALQFVGFIQTRLRNELVMSHNKAHSSWWYLNCFEKALELEGRLRSNANYVLMVESFLNQYLLYDYER